MACCEISPPSSRLLTVERSNGQEHEYFIRQFLSKVNLQLLFASAALPSSPNRPPSAENLFTRNLAE